MELITYLYNVKQKLRTMSNQISESEIRNLFIQESFHVDEMMNMFNKEGLELLGGFGMELYNTLVEEFETVTSFAVKEIILADRERVLDNLVVLNRAKMFMSVGFNFNLN